MPVVRMRTAPGILEELKALDPNTAVTLSYIRRLINSGRFPVVQVGKKKLVNLDLVLELMENGDAGQPAELHVMPGIRKVGLG